MNTSSYTASYTAICPLFNFGISEVLLGDYTSAQTKAYFKKVRQKTSQGFEISNNVRLAKIKPEDFQLIKRFAFGHPQSITHGLRPKMYVLEITGNEDDANEIRSVAEKVLLAFRLYKSDLIFCKLFLLSTALMGVTLVQYDPPFPAIPITPQPYLIKIDEINEVIKIAEVLDGLDFKKRKSLRIPCERLKRSYGGRKEDDRLIDSMIAFESLFMKGKARSNIGRFIGLGCSMLLGKNNQEREEIREFLIKAYSIRNDIVHGSEFSTPIGIGNKKYEMQDFLNQLRDLLRRSIMKLL